MQEPLVSIIIITRNRPFLLRHSIERALALSYVHKEVIVVDSSSQEESLRVIEQFPEVICVCLGDQRQNMPQARNEGLKVASGEILAFIDDDSMIQSGWIEALLNAYCDETVGAVGGRVIEMPEPYCDQESGLASLKVTTDGRVSRKGLGLLGSIDIEVDHLPGGNMSFRRQALESTGGFDPNYTLTNLREETDICVRVQKAGWRLLFSPRMAVVHFSLRAIRQPYFLERPLFQFSNGRNCMYFAIKHYGLNPRTLRGQLVDASRSCGRAAYFAGLFSIGALAQCAGRMAGLSVGILWLLDQQRRMASAPEVISEARVRKVGELANESMSSIVHDRSLI